MKYSILLFTAVTALVHAQLLTGVVLEKTDDGLFHPIIGANVYWLNTVNGTVTDTSGVFRVPINNSAGRLVVSYIGYTSDTVMITDQSKVNIILKADANKVAEVEIVGERQSTFVNYLSPQKTLVMTEKELFKAACCNLSESFETNPSIDVSFTDAVTGTKQIEMLGLSGTYTQITLENLPAVRGLTSTVGLTYVPGTWIENIQVSKGVGSVANGYESITGQINVELRKPQNLEEKQFFFNFFGNQDQRIEANLNLRTPLTEELSSMTLLHASTQRQRIDGNDDKFLDMPLYNTINAIQRFHFTNHTGWEGQLGIQFVDDEKRGGTVRGYNLDKPTLALRPWEYAFTMDGNQLRLWGKTGYVFQQKQYQSIGIQWSFTRNRQSSFFTSHEYGAYEQSGYLNLIYQSIFDNTMHKFRTGLSFLFDRYDETFKHIRYERTERVPGAFFEYTYTPGDEFSMIAGVRADHHNLFGTFFTPRLHLRFTPQEDWVFRAVAGRGQRTSNIFAENMAYFASSRHVVVLPSNTQPLYGFDPEVATNLGFNVTHYFFWDYREATIAIDFYRTDFDRQVVVDLDANAQQVHFYNLNGRSFSNSVQIELNIQPIEQLDTRIAYRLYDVRQTINGTLRARPFVAQHRAFINFGYANVREDEEDANMLYDVTLQWFGTKRLPDTQMNPIGLQSRAYSPSFILANTQITRSFYAGFDLYLGIENLTNFRQSNPILDAANPNGNYFDSALIWGPIYGRTMYAGLRWRI
ncbi:MAG: TonB-dependent receptor [Bacteriovoracaceae bacterium]|nr:TonB-dependent receptor [Bacteroidota bacterium]